MAEYKYAKITEDTQRANEFFTNRVAYTLGPVELKDLMEKHPERINIVDVRYEKDYAEGRIPTAINITIHGMEENLSSLVKDKINVLYCYSGVCHLAAQCAVIATANGFPTMELEGGFKTWQDHGFTVVK